MKRGFTLIELIVVIAIIMVLSSVVLASINSARSKIDSNYEICNADGCEYVDSYTKEANCVFIAEKELRICGDYTIEKINKDND